MVERFIVVVSFNVLGGVLIVVAASGRLREAIVVIVRIGWVIVELEMTIETIVSRDLKVE